MPLAQYAHLYRDLKCEGCGKIDESRPVWVKKARCYECKVKRKTEYHQMKKQVREWKDKPYSPDFWQEARKKIDDARLSDSLKKTFSEKERVSYDDLPEELKKQIKLFAPFVYPE